MGLAVRGVSEVIALLLAAVTGIWISRAVGPADFGLYALVWALVQIGSLLVALGTTTAGSQRVANHPETARETWGAILIVRGAALAVVVSVAGGALLFAPVSSVLQSMLAFGLLAVAAATVRVEWLFVGFGRPVVLALIRMASSAAALIVAVLAVRGPEDAPIATAAIAAQTVTLSALGSVIAVLRVGPPRLGISPVEVLRDGLVYIRNELAVFTYTNSDRLFLYVFATPVILGLYDAAYRLIQPMYAISAVVGDAMYAPLAQAFGKPSFRQVFARYVDLMSVVTIPFGAFCAVASSWLIASVYGATYADSAQLLSLLGWVITLGYVAGIAIIPMGAWNRAREFASGTETGGVADLILNLALIPWLGGVGAALATIGANAVTVFAGLRNFRRITEYRLARHLAGYLTASLAAMLGYLVAGAIAGPIAGTATFGVMYLALAYLARERFLGTPTQ